MTIIEEALAELNKLDEEFDDDFDTRWGEEFGDTDKVIIMSPEDTMKQLREMENFK